MLSIVKQSLASTDPLAATILANSCRCIQRICSSPKLAKRVIRAGFAEHMLSIFVSKEHSDPSVTAAALGVLARLCQHESALDLIRRQDGFSSCLSRVRMHIGDAVVAQNALAFISSLNPSSGTSALSHSDNIIGKSSLYIVMNLSPLKPVRCSQR
jgi:hypothetical protein